MASHHHFDPLHLLVKTQYGSEAGHRCDICLTGLAGDVGHYCRACDIDLHDACASYFEETISFFAHPEHTLKLSRIPSRESSGMSWACDLCMEECPRGSFVYRCAQCLFDVHPLCTMIPQTIRVPQHQEHDFRMVPSCGNCSACDQSLPVWHYACPCAARLHVGCASALVAAAGEGDEPAATQTASSSCTVGRPRRRRRTAIAKFLLKASVRVAVDVATGGLGSPVLDILSAVFS